MALAVVSSNSQWFFKVSHINWVSAEVLEVASGFALFVHGFIHPCGSQETLHVQGDLPTLVAGSYIPIDIVTSFHHHLVALVLDVVARQRVAVEIYFV